MRQHDVELRKLVEQAGRDELRRRRRRFERKTERVVDERRRRRAAPSGVVVLRAVERMEEERKPKLLAAREERQVLRARRCSRGLRPSSADAPRVCPARPRRGRAPSSPLSGSRIGIAMPATKRSGNALCASIAASLTMRASLFASSCDAHCHGMPPESVSTCICTLRASIHFMRFSRSNMSGLSGPLAAASPELLDELDVGLRRPVRVRVDRTRTDLRVLHRVLLAASTRS